MNTKVFISSIALFASFSSFSKTYDCIEVNVFEVDRENISSRAFARAAEIPEETLNIIQTYVRTELNIDKNGLEAKKGAEDLCPSQSSALELKGTVSDYKKGSRVMRYMVGFGAGKQKIQIEAELYDKETGELLKKDRVVDRKIGGLIGGSENKGKRDFAEKMNNFVRTALGMKRSKL
ncbi:DUF4410 domain-containing protein [Marinicella rhabdoformis]|uniref:DUF4410 domain-containing protein n=1 Tax=Marinicella rhabdoformis TaxID=2580566 RepID=UPI0015D01AC1|nr:DUF4410 domain-containing protein [Marinicella rhabdoformis]